MQRHEHDRGAEADPFRPAGDPAERDERVVDAAVRVDRFGADDDVLRGSDRIEPELLGELDSTADPVGIRIQAVVRQDHAEVHNSSLTAAC